MIWNIVDGRERKFRWKKINAVIENTAHDNSVEDADQLKEANETAPTCEERVGVSLHEAIVWAETEPGKVTLYLYDEGKGIAQ